MSAITGIANVLIGFAYVALGFLAIEEMRKQHALRGISWFGFAFCAMAFTCGPHHLAHAIHVQEGEHATAWECVAVLVSLPPGMIFVWLRIEALRGGAGDRLILGTPGWLKLFPAGFGLLVGVVLFGSILESAPLWRDSIDTLITLPLTAALVVLYGLVGWYLARTQIRRTRDIGGWSLSGLMLTLIFPTCALTHVTYAFAGATDIHTLVIDILAVPAAVWFLWVVRAIYLEHADDWNRRPLVGAAVVPQRPAPWDEDRSGAQLARRPISSPV